jgi:hypothetical protein
MLKPYNVTYEFYYDGVHENTESYTLLLEEPINKEIAGTDFDTLWNLRCKGGYFVVNWNRCERKKGRAFARWDALFCHVHEWKNDIKPWKVVVTSEETTILMSRLMQFETEKVIQYLKERGITTCPMNF